MVLGTHIKPRLFGAYYVPGSVSDTVGDLKLRQNARGPN